MKRFTWAAFSSVAVTMAFLGACVGDEPAMNGPTTGTPAEAGVDGNGGGADGGGMTETSTPDAAQPNDAGADSACANMFAGAAFCDDFDNGGYGPAWMQVNGGAGVTISVVSSPNYSAPFALAARTTATAPAGGSSLKLETLRSTAGATEFTLGARVQVPASSAAVGTNAPLVLRLAAATNAFVLFQIRPNGAVAACTTAGAQLGGFTTGDVPFTYGAWHHVVLKAVVSGANLNLSCDVDGVSRTMSVADVVNANAVVQAGLTVTEGQDPMTVLFDDVVYDAK